MKRLKYFLFLSLISSSICTARTITLVGEQWNPYIYEKNGSVVGMNAEIIREVFKRLGQEVELKVIKWDKAWKSIQDGTSDGAFLVPYKKRNQGYVFYPATQDFDADYVFFTNKQTLKSGFPSDYNDAVRKGYRVGLVSGFAYTRKFWKVWGSDNSMIIRSPNMKEALRLLNQGKVQLVPLIKEIGSRTAYFNKFTNIRMRKEDLFGKPYMTVFSKKANLTKTSLKSPENLSKVYEKALFDFKQTDKYQEILTRWSAKLN